MDAVGLDFPTLLKGTDVTLRSLEPSDARLLAQAASENRETYKFSPVPQGDESARDYVRKALNQKTTGERFPYAIIWRNRVVGTSSYMEFKSWSRLGQPPRRSPDVVEIGYTWLAASAQRTGCNTEAKLLLLEHAFEVWSVERVSFRTDERNARSRDAILRIGAQFEGVRRADSLNVEGNVRHSAYFSILQAEWPGVKAALRAKLSLSP